MRTGVVYLFALVPLATPVLADAPGLSALLPPPGDVPARAVPFDPAAPLCTDEVERGAPPGGRLMDHAGLVLHVCRDIRQGFEPGNEGPERLYVNHARVPGLTFEHYAGRVWLTDFSSYDESLACDRGPDCPRPGLAGVPRWDTLMRHERHGGALYEVWQDPDRPVYDLTTRPPTPIIGPSPYPAGNTYVFVPEPGTAAVPRHHVVCLNEPIHVWKNESGGCFINVDYRGRLAHVQLWGAGPGYGEDSGYVQMHPLFPHFARDIHALLSAVDATDDPARQDCVRGGGDWREEGCQWWQ